MKEKFIDEIKDAFVQARSWLECEVEYVKLTAAEKFTILLSSLILGGVCVLLGLFAISLVTMALVDFFKSIMDPSLAFLSVAGIVVFIIIVIILLRKPLLYNPIARFITRLFLDK